MARTTQEGTSGGKLITKALPEKLTIEVQPINFQIAVLKIKGTARLVLNKYTRTEKDKMKSKHERGSVSQITEGKDRSRRDFARECQEKAHRGRKGYGFPTSAIRSAMVDVCRVSGLQMIRAKMAIQIIPDDWDLDDEMPLVLIEGGEPEMSIVAAPNAGPKANLDLRSRPMWREWGATITIKFDADIIAPEQIVNLLNRAGQQVGIGAGRPLSKRSCGVGWGTFVVVGEAESRAVA